MDLEIGSRGAGWGGEGGGFHVVSNTHLAGG